MKFILGLPAYSLYKLIQKYMENENLYQRQELSKAVHLIQVPEGKIYLIDCEGNGTGKRPVFVPTSINKQIEEMKNVVTGFFKKLEGDKEFVEEVTDALNNDGIGGFEKTEDSPAEENKEGEEKTKTTKKTRTTKTK